MRLNPFVYVPETDIRFYLLVLIGIMVPSFWALIFGIIISSVVVQLQITFLLRLLIMGLIVSFVPLLIYWNYRRFPKKITKQSRLREFDPEKFPDHSEYIDRLYGGYMPTAKRPELMYQPLDPSESAFTFGTRNHLTIGMSGGLIRKFRRSVDGFKSIFLHEMGHLVNGDVEKTYLVVSTWRSLFLTLSIPLGVFLLYLAYLTLRIFFSGVLAGYDMDYIIESMNLGQGSLLLGGIALYLLIFLAIVYVLRNQIIRLREFYADARVLEWEESSEEIVKTLQETGTEQHSKFEILTKFHPNVNERVQVLKDNSKLLTPSLWVAFASGFFYVIIEFLSSFLKTLILPISGEWTALTSAEYQPSVELNIAFRAFISILVFTVLMLAISSSFHKSILKDIFANNARYFSTATMLNVIKFSLVFSFGWLTYHIISFPQVLSLYEAGVLMGQLIDIAKAWIPHAVYFAVALIYLIIFASMLIRRSFSKEEAVKNFLIISVSSSLLYVVNRFAAIEVLHNRLLLIVFFLAASVLTYAFIRVRDGKLRCPNCNSRMPGLSEVNLNCPNCHHDLYSWAIYPFSKNTVS